MGNYIFYTPQDLACLLIDLVPREHAISSVIDICSGSWNLLNAAKQKYPNAKLVGVDIDKSSASHKIANAEFVCCDGRTYADNQSKKGRRFDLILSNPPFGPLTVDEKKYSIKGNIFADSKRYEAEMLWANYQLMSANSTLVIILPSTYVDGSSYVNYRKWLAKNCYVRRIIRLPQNTFAKSKLNTVALILQKKQTKQHVTKTEIYQASYSSAWKISRIGTVTQADIDCGFWSGSCVTVPKKSSTSIFRGSISSKFFADKGDEILHCSSLFSHKRWRPSLRYCDGAVSSQKKYAKRGDIIINRIGRSAGYWCIYHGKKRLISDCLIVIPAPSAPTIAQMEAASICHRLSIPLRGVSTQYITMEDILNKLEAAI